MVLPDDNPAAQPFERVVLPHLDAGYNLARWLLGDAHTAQDVVQDAVLRALRHFDTYRGGDARAWFLRIVRNTAMTALSARSRARSVSLESAGGDDEEQPALMVADTGGTPEQLVALGQVRTTLDRALAGLPTELRECLVLRELEELSYRDIAGITGVPVGTVMSRLFRARKLLAGTIDRGDRP